MSVTLLVTIALAVLIAAATAGFTSRSRSARTAVIGIMLFDDCPESGAMVHLVQVRQFMHDDVVDDMRRKMDQPPVQPDA